MVQALVDAGQRESFVNFYTDTDTKSWNAPDIGHCVANPGLSAESLLRNLHWSQNDRFVTLFVFLSNFNAPVIADKGDLADHVNLFNTSRYALIRQSKR